MPLTYALIPGAGGAAWLWQRVTPLLTAAGHQVVAIDLPVDDDAAGLPEYTDIVCAAVVDAAGPLVLVALSMGAFIAPMVAARVPTEQILLVNPMVPAPGETAGDWWSATGQKAAMLEQLHRINPGRNTFDEFEDFFHDVPASVREAARQRPEPRQSDTPFGQPWPLPGWPDVPTAVIQGSDDRLFPLEFQRRVVRDRLGLDLDVVPGGHLAPLSHPAELAEWILSHQSQSHPPRTQESH